MVTDTETRTEHPVVRVLRFPTRQMRRVYDWTIGWSRTKYARVVLILVAFSESAFFIVPPDLLIIPMVLTNRRRWWLIASEALIASIAGAVFGYVIGAAVFDAVGRPIIDLYGLTPQFEDVGRLYDENAFLTLFTAAFTPIPFKVFTIAGGVFQISLPEFIAGAVVGRAARFFLVAGLVRIFGEPISRFIERWFDILALAFGALLVGGFVVLRIL